MAAMTAAPGPLAVRGSGPRLDSPGDVLRDALTTTLATITGQATTAGTDGGGTAAVVSVLVAAVLILLVVVVVVLLVRRLLLRCGVDRVVTLLAAGVALVLSADGAYRLLTRALGLPAWEAAVVAAVAELALIAEAVRAERSIRAHGHPGGHQYAIAGIALGAGFVVSTNAQSLPEWLVRFLVPQLAALLWWMGAREHLTQPVAAGPGTAGRRSVAGSREGTTWLVSPRRLAVQMGLIAATDGVDDLHALTRARRVRALARLLHRHTHTQSATVRRWRARRVHRLAETADTATITAVADQLTRTRTVLGMAGLLTDPAPPAPAPPVPVSAPSAPPHVVDTTSPDRLHDGATDAIGDTAHRPHGAPTVAPRAAGVAAPPPGGRPPRLARVADITRVRAALAAGDLTAPLTASAISGHLGISREYAAAARQALDEATAAADLAGDAPAPAARPSSPPPTGRPDGTQPTQPEPSGPAEQPLLSRPAPAHGDDQIPAGPGPQRRSDPVIPSFTHA